VHLDDEIYRVLVRLGIAEQFAAVSRPTRGLQLIDRSHRVFAVFDRTVDQGRHGHPQANLFDQPELEDLLRTNLKDQVTVILRGNVEVSDVAQDGQDRDRLTGEPESVLATYVLGCDGANSVVRTAIGATMEDLEFEHPGWWSTWPAWSSSTIRKACTRSATPSAPRRTCESGRPVTAGSSDCSRARPPRLPPR
jgi:3-(3-hydroxy-phenyl)propionate hydroxylase